MFNIRHLEKGSLPILRRNEKSLVPKSSQKDVRGHLLAGFYSEIFINTRKIGSTDHLVIELTDQF